MCQIRGELNLKSTVKWNNASWVNSNIDANFHDYPMNGDFQHIFDTVWVCIFLFSFHFAA